MNEILERVIIAILFSINGYFFGTSIIEYKYRKLRNLIKKLKQDQLANYGFTDINENL